MKIGIQNIGSSATHFCFSSLIVVLVGSKLFISDMEFFMSVRPLCSACAFISEVEDDEET